MLASDSDILLLKPLSNGNVVDLGVEDVKAMQLQSIIGSAAEILHQTNLSQSDKNFWAFNLRDSANKLFRDGLVEEAMEKYTECLIASNFSEIRSDNNVQLLVVPVLCNLASCTIQMKKLDKAIKFCETALSFDPSNSRAQFLLSLAIVLDGMNGNVTCNEQSINNAIKTLKHLWVMDKDSRLSESNYRRIPGILKDALKIKKKLIKRRGNLARAMKLAFSKSSTSALDSQVPVESTKVLPLKIVVLLILSMLSLFIAYYF